MSRQRGCVETLFPYGKTKLHLSNSQKKATEHYYSNKLHIFGNSCNIIHKVFYNFLGYFYYIIKIFLLGNVYTFSNVQSNLAMGKSKKVGRTLNVFSTSFKDYTSSLCKWNSINNFPFMY